MSAYHSKQLLYPTKNSSDNILS